MWATLNLTQGERGPQVKRRLPEAPERKHNFLQVNMATTCSMFFCRLLASRGSANENSSPLAPLPSRLNNHDSQRTQKCAAISVTRLFVCLLARPTRSLARCLFVHLRWTAGEYNLTIDCE